MENKISNPKVTVIVPIYNTDIYIFTMFADGNIVTKIIVQIHGCYYHYRRNNSSSITHGYGKNAVYQMINCASQLSDFFSSQPDATEYKEVTTFIKYLAKINLITDTYRGIIDYKKTFPDVKLPPKKFDKSAFSSKGLIRYYFVRYHFAWLFVLLYKIINRINVFR